jgi:hypothetical protein
MRKRFCKKKFRSLGTASPDSVGEGLVDIISRMVHFSKASSQAGSNGFGERWPHPFCSDDFRPRGKTPAEHASWARVVEIQMLQVSRRVPRRRFYPSRREPQIS